MQENRQNLRTLLKERYDKDKQILGLCINFGI